MASAIPGWSQSGSLLGVSTQGTPQGQTPAPVTAAPAGPTLAVPQLPQVPLTPPLPPKGGQPPVGFGLVQVRTTLNVRTGPWGPIIGSLGPNSLIKIIGKEGDWYVIEYKGQRAYVHSQYIFTPPNSPFASAPTPPGVIQNPAGSIVRATPWGNTVGNIPAGTPVTILGRTKDWIEVQSGSTVGYVPVHALDPNAPMPGVPRARYGVPGYTGPGYTPFTAPQPLNVPGSGSGAGARAANGPDRHPNLPTVNMQVFPVPGATKFSDDWGIGTHSPGASPYNMGIDIFAPQGSPILAPVGGRVTEVGSNRMGGLTVHLVGPDGTDYYFAHMVAHAQGITPGMVIPAGTLIGYVGNTGNASGGPTHLHFAAVRGGSAIAAYRGLASLP